LHVVWDEPALRNFDCWLMRYADSWLGELRNHLASLSADQRDWLLHYLRQGLMTRVEFWKLEGRRYLLGKQQEHKKSAGKPAGRRKKRKPKKSADPRAEINAFIRKNRAAGHEIARKQIASVARSSLRSLYRFQNGTATPEVNAVFRGTLELSPEEFQQKLTNKPPR
jgi:hypothetical protein